MSSDNAIIPTPPATSTKRMRPGPNKNGRTLCAHRWLNGVAKEGTAPDFKTYWTALPKARKQASSLVLIITVLSPQVICLQI
ncbi:hypothetical protein K503DRAFT_219013 [Rhizopogon vinicolor AM-OR11-026]|uniref:Uncharacterized protein n=1 Tax=Rhizopogon vinicolor AM-OR11-026 TaxID=1314800 RepID=A0A1B7MD78_9AGAM|nr:hypothetical protein K503DRAFT_219013 [Rhizopogon vinicolor AM-OR11-026]